MTSGIGRSGMKYGKSLKILIKGGIWNNEKKILFLCKIRKYKPLPNCKTVEEKQGVLFA